MTPRTGRRPGASGASTAIILAARRRFADLGYDGATFRGIAAEAGVDPALIRHYYGTKENLFVAAMRLPFSLGDALDEALRSDPEHLGEDILRAALRVWELPQARAIALGVVRAAATQDQAARMLQQFIQQTIVRRIADSLDTPQADLRASLVASQIAGLTVTRYLLRIEPIASLTADELSTAIAPTLQRYLTGNITHPNALRRSAT
jgi:AcrR family transcriptional regulator